MDERGGFVQKILFIHTVFIYTGCVHFVPFGGRKFDRRNEVLAETGGAVSALTPEVSTLCYVNPGAGNRRRKGTPAGRAPVPEETRMGAVDIVVLILKLMVAVLQLLDAVLKQLR